VLVDAGGVVDVVVDVDDVELRLIDGMRGGMQHGDRLEVFEKERLFLLGVGGGFVADLGGWRRRCRDGILRDGIRYETQQVHDQRGNRQATERPP
jgi:hypothetical protein